MVTETPLKTVMAVAGGSGGHIFPAIAFCHELRAQKGDSVIINLVLVMKSGRAAEVERLRKEIPLEFNPCFLTVNRTLVGAIKLILRSHGLIRRARPYAVVGFGGYVSVPFILGARLGRAKAVIHEQNVVPGRANRFLAPWVDRIGITFSPTIPYLRREKRKIGLTRYPLRPFLKPVSKDEARRYFGLSESVFTLLVVGGSQGAHQLNEKFLASLKEGKNLGDLQIIHLTGAKDLARAGEAYRDLPVRAKVIAFLAEMQYAYSAADLVVGRSGAGCVVELMRFSLPSILVPYAHAKGHQVENAKFLAEAGAAILLEEARWTPQLFNGLLTLLVNDGMRRRTMAHIAARLYETSSALSLTELVFS